MKKEEGRRKRIDVKKEEDRCEEGRRKEKTIPCLPNSIMPNAQCPMPNSQFPIPNSQCPGATKLLSW
ncbi:MAG: hypothetical protein EAZ60_01740 [Oscillatoriales cyanobacterium]|uniref:hypothetical protein n=1 Tax=Microcoleus sp. PH2017_27_LUM_O_A TaxID=2798837 RepID=UPI001D74CE08|nr:hypothetical protein [Microcoleus sp. PH2017_27_LUM_O_A]MCC3460146.1 hypothetical protein [Microcoleus sp. PH2017_11_PCY_U_A]TAE79703.1 MAG: hypothetical protein EAZ83_20635 [Oscillatoriales cyanobacterium]MCC3559454.1 hypothetical protein [Microcoleus sp. PH2017_27_LUM_O_A]TAF00603.1 MAG: hypothetical protein EAZ79_02120 [Oscillatoriales cyanobacterium]TAF17271.1 MAG: hypothetical protein EAZ73_21855 [Oscillatoriales cyanobacterium]